MNLTEIQQALQSERLDGWLFYDFRKSNPIAFQVLSLPLDGFFSRRWFYYIPARGEPTRLVSSVESHVLDKLTGARLVFRTWQELQAHLGSILSQAKRVAMEYSPMNAIPYLSRVDAGTIELVRACGVEVVSSADLAQRFGAQLSQAQMESHREAGRRLVAAKDTLFSAIGRDLREGIEIDEYSTLQRFAALIEQAGLVVEQGLPHVAINANASNPHYEPSAAHHSPIRRGDLVLFDFWASLPGSDSIIADYTWMAFAGTREEIPARQREVFAIVSRARDAAIDFARGRMAAGERVEGHEVDDAARRVIADAGYGDYFIHRTGHSIGRVVHADGANMDNYETRDERTLLPSTCCSIEPGIYLPEFGIRSEVNMLIHERDVEVTGVPAQQEIVALM
ncbi:MAG TPA: M24 family metallopeptidase [Ktedonobacteraceae bacterium]|nr:M24 family metallopeptidase [Ktedonobacteraceae bacterium]